MSELSTEFASMDKGYTPNRKEMNMKKAYREALSNHPTGNAAIVLNAEDISYGDLKGTSRKATDIKNNYKIQLQQKNFTRMRDEQTNSGRGSSYSETVKQRPS